MKFDEWKITKEQIIDAIKLAKKHEEGKWHYNCDNCFIKYLAIDIQNKAHVIVLGACQRTKKNLNSQYHTKYNTEEPICSGEVVSYLPLIRALLHRTIRI